MIFKASSTLISVRADKLLFFELTNSSNQKIKLWVQIIIPEKSYLECNCSIMACMNVIAFSILA